jgi:phenylacetate-CoA ligase
MVCTILHRRTMPMIRFNLRDLTRSSRPTAATAAAASAACRRMLGRSDTMVRIRGVSIWPQACLPAIKSDTRTTGEWLCIADAQRATGVGARRNDREGSRCADDCRG